MANKRNFKKSVEALTAALVDEMMASYYNEEAADREKISSAITKVISAMENAKLDTAKLFNQKMKDFSNLKEYNKAKIQHNKAKYAAAIENFNNTLNEALNDYNAGMPKNEIKK